MPNISLEVCHMCVELCVIPQIPNVTLYPLRTSGNSGRELFDENKWVLSLRHLFECQTFETLNNYHWPYCCFSQFKLKCPDHPKIFKQPPKKLLTWEKKRWWTELLTSTIRIWHSYKFLGRAKFTLLEVSNLGPPISLLIRSVKSLRDLGHFVKNSCQAITYFTDILHVFIKFCTFL